MNQIIRINLDLDGVLCKFDERVVELTGTLPHILDAKGELWSTLATHPSFFRNLEPHHDMVHLAQYLHEIGVPMRVITGRPRNHTFPSACQDKIDWVHQHLSADLNVIVCLARDKQHYCDIMIDDVLIDDRPDNIERWRHAGGIGIFHTSYANTKQQLSHLLNIKL